MTERAHGGRNMGTDTIFGPSRRIFDTRSEIWGQTRCRVRRSGTFNVQRSTLNFQRGDRKGAWWAGYGDRHDIWPGPPDFSHAHPDMGTDTMSGTPIRNVQRPTFNSQLSTECPKGCMVTGIWGQTRCSAARRANRGTDTTFGPGGPDF